MRFTKKSPKKRYCQNPNYNLNWVRHERDFTPLTHPPPTPNQCQMASNLRQEKVKAFYLAD